MSWCLNKTHQLQNASNVFSTSSRTSQITRASQTLLTVSLIRIRSRGLMRLTRSLVLVARSIEAVHTPKTVSVTQSNAYHHLRTSFASEPNLLNSDRQQLSIRSQSETNSPVLDSTSAQRYSDRAARSSCVNRIRGPMGWSQRTHCIRLCIQLQRCHQLVLWHGSRESSISILQHLTLSLKSSHLDRKIFINKNNHQTSS